MGTKPSADRLYLRNAIYFAILHVAPFCAIFTGVPARVWLAAFVLYWVRIWFVTAGYHCYFSHRSFKTSRVFQFLLALGAQTSAQGSALQWATAHRWHHAYSDRDDDLHSPIRRSFWYSHIGWLFSTRYLEPSTPRSGPFIKYPELMWLHRHPHVAPIGLMVFTLVMWGLPGLFIAYGLSTVLVYHATFCVNSVTHRFGTRPFDTPDGSRNNWFVAIIMLGGGWHNNHHRDPRSARQGVRWWEFDPTYYALVVLGWFGIVRDIREPRQLPEAVTVSAERRTQARSRRSY